MMSAEAPLKAALRCEPLPGFEPEIGRWLWALEEVRRATLTHVEAIDQQTLDWSGTDGADNSIGTLLYHIALVEMSWLFMDIFEGELPEVVRADFPYDMADGSGGLARVEAVTLEDHLRRLRRSRAVFLDALRGFSLEEWRRPRSPADVEYHVTPEWAVFHLIEHEAAHAAQVAAMKRRAERYFASGR
jgi:uncharacterized damage-inducible protein DinB